MQYSNRVLKETYLDRRYRDLLLPLEDRNPMLPVSSGNPVIDSCVFEKVRPSTNMSIEEHLMRSFQLVSRATDAEIDAMMPYLGQCLNDHKCLLAMRLFHDEDEDRFARVFRALPWGWKLQLPTAFVKPGEVFFTGWKRQLRFRLYPEVPFTRLKRFLGELFVDMPEIVVLKYRDKIKTALALLHYRLDTTIEKDVGRWCFDRQTSRLPALPVIDLFLRLRDKAKAWDETGFVQVLKGDDRVIPITSYMGLLGTLDVELNTTGEDYFREYAIRCATVVESLLRLNEWHLWLTDDHLDVLKRRFLDGHAKGRLSLTRVTKAYVNLPYSLQRGLTEEVFVPLLKGLATDLQELVPPEFEFLIPRSFFIFTNFLLYLVLNTVAAGRLTTFHRHVVEHHTFTLDVLSEIVQMDYPSFDDYLFKTYRKEYDTRVSPVEFDTVTRHVEQLPTNHMLLIDLPLARAYDFLHALNQHDTVFNIHSNVGIAGEISLNPAPVQVMEVQVGGQVVFNCSIETPRDKVVEFVNLLEKMKMLTELHARWGGAMR